MTEWIEEAKKLAVRDDPDRDYLAYTITLKYENLVVGSIGCSYYDDFQETGITYFIGAKYRNNGYAAEAVQAYTKYFLRHYNVKGMIATVRNENVVWINIYRKRSLIIKYRRNKVMFCC